MNSRDVWDELYASYEVLRDSRSRRLYDQELDIQHCRDGLESNVAVKKEDDDAQRNREADFGPAKEVFERALWGEETVLHSCRGAVLQHLCRLVSDDPWLEETSQRPQQIEHVQPFNKCGICRHRRKHNYFNVYVVIKSLTIECTARSWEQAIDFRLCLSELKAKAFDRISGESDQQNSVRVTKEELLSAVKTEPRMKLVFRFEHASRKKSPRFRDYTAVGTYGVQWLYAQGQTAQMASLKRMKRACEQNEHDRRKWFGKLKQDLMVEMSRSLGTANEAANEASSLAVALQLSPQEARQLARQILSLPRAQFESRRDAAMKHLRGQLELTWAKPIQALADEYNDVCGRRSANSQHPQLCAPAPFRWTVIGVDIPLETCGAIAQGLSLVDLAKLKAASRGSKYIHDVRISEVLRNFTYQLCIVGTAKRSRHGRVIKTYSYITEHRKWLHEFLPTYSHEFHCLNLTHMLGRLLEHDSVKDTFKRMSSLRKVVLPKQGWSTPYQKRLVCQSFASTVELA